ncbi:hypothetical protein L21SP5_03925 [Salinivirga cyanobacteriivorans]|uniref:Uncharacterized protein n=2 Tax=Salinivirgaceae TaxID=1970190 RepID=A0A0S2I6A4_9BACT|nr:hypothetical protein L21SP5_03925 [Salinivirga cyanobacteriivorans]
MKMLDHQKNILRNLHHNHNLFIKEIKKSIQWLSEQELKDLEQWISKELVQVYDHEVQRLFRMAV